MTDFLTTGTLLGLSAGFAPGPLLALIVAETLRHDLAAGVRVALAPLFTDLPIIVLTLFVLGRLTRFDAALGVISLAGAVLVFWLGLSSLRSRSVSVEWEETRPRSLLKGVLVNLASPHPYLFWFGVGAPMTLRAYAQGGYGAPAFIGSFYLFLIGSKILLAILVARSRNFLSGKVYLFIMRLLGLLLMGFALVLLRDGLRSLGLWP